jgi:hypothetical protein
MARRLWRGAGRIGQQDECGRLGCLLGKGVVEDQTKHAALGDIVGAHRDLVGLAFAVPLYGDEPLLRKLVLCCADISLGEETGLRLGDSVCVLLGAVEVVGVGGEVRAASARVFNDGEVTVRAGSVSRLDSSEGGCLKGMTELH